MKKFLFILCAALFLASGKSYAQEQFDINYDVVYEIDALGQTDVSQNIKITNKKSDTIASNYSLIVRQLRIFDVGVTSESQKVEHTVIEEENETVVRTLFKNTIVGKDKTNDFTINYKTFDIASNVGNIWHVDVPKVNLLSSTKKYGVKVVVPAEFGPEIFISPEPIRVIETTENITYEFNRESLDETGISASFGTFQAVNFKLSYTLQNPTHFSVTKEIALPPDVQNMQQVSYKSIQPQPMSLRVDEDGNVLAEYTLKPNETIDVKLIGTARLHGVQIKPEFGGSIFEIDKDLVNKYTKPSEYWNTNTKEIEDIVKNLLNEDATTAQNAKAAYDFVLNNLEYDFEILDGAFIERKGSIGALADSTGTSCMEFTDLFIAITRAMGIPAREINGHAFTSNDDLTAPLSINLEGGDLLHSWAEFYDPNFGWVAVDPTWGSTTKNDYFTKLDTGHFAFVRKGIDPVYPIPAGGYKTEGSERQVDIEIAQTQEENDFLPSVTVEEVFPTNFYKGFWGNKKYALKNEGQIAVYVDGNVVLPFETKSIYINKEISTLRYKDAVNKGYEIKLGSEKNYQTILFVLFVVQVLSLCGIFYVLLFRLEAQKKLAHHLRRLPQVLNRLSNRR